MNKNMGSGIKPRALFFALTALDPPEDAPLLFAQRWRMQESSKLLN